LGEDQPQKKVLARAWLDAAVGIHLFMIRHYPEERFLSGLSACQERLQAARDNLEKGVPEGTLLEAQDVINELTLQRVELDRKEWEWTLARRAAREWAAWLYELARSSQVCLGLSQEGHPTPEIEVDFWTQGRFGRVMDYIRQVYQHCDRAGSSLGPAVLTGFLEVELPQVEAALAELVRHARLRALNSQLRTSICEIALQALEEQGYSLSQAGFTGDDPGQDFCAAVINERGSEVLINIVPAGGLYGEHELHLTSRDPGVRARPGPRPDFSLVYQALQRWDLQVEPGQERVVQGWKIAQPAPAGRKSQVDASYVR
jgi:hypothetical protein